MPWMLGVALAGGCAAQSGGEPRSGTGGAIDGPGVSGGPGVAGDVPVAGSGGSLVNADGDPIDVMIPEGGGRKSIGSTPLPCELDTVLATSCRSCHGADPGLQAPMALVTHEDLMAPSITNPDRPTYELVSERVHSDVAPMPPVGRGRALVDSELGMIDGWVAGGALAGNEACGTPELPPTTGITYEAPSEDEIDQCYRFASHENGTTAPYMARSGEYYSCFFFDVPWEGEKQAVSFRSIDTSITHHWLLYDTPEALPDGTAMECLGTHPGAPDLLAAWAVNQQRDQFMPKEAGLKLPVKGSGRKFLVEVHYFNPGGPVPDESGVEVCVGKELRPNTATVSWLGTEAIALAPGLPADLTGTCTPPYEGDIYIFRSFPHMHETGYHMTTTIKRGDGTMDTLVDQPFDFNNQLAFDTPAVIKPDDQLLTTCRFQNNTDRFIGVGYDSLSEMCFNFVYAWPANALVNGISLTGASTPCLL